MDESGFSAAWTNFTRDRQLSHATYSITVLDGSTGESVFDFNRNVGMSPASTMKTVTGAAALHYLGADYRYETLLQYSGSIDTSGVLNGYIYIVGKSACTLNHDECDRRVCVNKGVVTLVWVAGDGMRLKEKPLCSDGRIALLTEASRPVWASLWT